jgi:tRNA(Ile)-lysidine synthase
LHDLFNTDLDRIPCVTWQGAELHWHRGLLYADAPSDPLADSHLYEGAWAWRDAFELPANLGRLWMRPTAGPGFSAARLPERIAIRFRRGREKIRLPGRQHRSALRNLLQDGDVLPWWRDRLPYVFAGKQLLAVGDAFISAEFAAAPGEVALVPVWEGAPEWKAVRA